MKEQIRLTVVLTEEQLDFIDRLRKRYAWNRSNAVRCMVDFHMRLDEALEASDAYIEEARNDASGTHEGFLEREQEWFYDHLKRGLVGAFVDIDEEDDA